MTRPLAQHPPNKAVTKAKMQPQRLPLQDTLQSLPPEWADDPLPANRARLARSGRKIVVLDDDVMGTQSVHDIAVLTDWSVDAIRAELSRSERGFFILTNSRGMPASQAQAVNAFIARNLSQAAERAGADISIVSRLDSTLRGHFPIEMQAIQGALPRKPRGWIIAPLFIEGGRYTIDDTQYAADGDALVPVGDTEFARDPAFPFQASNLREWVEEKTAGGVAAADVASVSIADLRGGGPPQVAARLTATPEGGVCVVNGASDRDMEVFVQGLLTAEEATGGRFLFRAAASLIRALLGQSDRALLAPAELGIDRARNANGALIVVGSYVPRTTRQLNHLFANTDAAGIQADAPSLLSNERRGAEIRRVARQAQDALSSCRNAVIFTSRALVEGRSADHSLAIGHQIGQALCEIVSAIAAKPRYIVVKGGATSGNVATNALNVRRAWSPGQAVPGVPVWLLGDETPHPGTACVIFPGNVGGEDALTELTRRLDGG